MVKTVVAVEGMMCPMCEKHVNESIQENFKIESVVSSKDKKETEIISEAALDEAALTAAITEAGYTVKGISVSNS